MTRKVKLEDLYKDKRTLEVQAGRFKSLLSSFSDIFRPAEAAFFSSPGRIELGGNHTDHNNGCILASAIDIDTIAIAARNDLNIINLVSRNLDQTYSVNLAETQPKAEERGTASGLIRGIAARFLQKGHQIGGFDCILESNIGIGSGLSSSASVEVLAGMILNDFYNSSFIPPVEIAKYGQYSENNYFGKPCGLMDQLAISTGGIIFVDFMDKDNPKVEKLDFNFSDYGFEAVIVNTGSTHADLTDDYASVPHEMKAVARYFGKEFCRFIKRKDIVNNMAELRKTLGDRAVLRALHFLEENERVKREAEALKKGDPDGFFLLAGQSGNSSSKWLQNVYSSKDVRQQGLSIALELTEHYLRDNSSRGACRVHGGGFAGTILTFLESSLLSGYLELMNKIFGQDSALKVRVRAFGACGVLV
ncbi:MAG: galactokinase [Ignavibacteria bacterium]|nr:galactokinase [Ignavibacteria bacterium]MCU7504581.1 galactokinase [Ignavibacteria bacterium]MCU7516581.1 galactokinase [Ignavibacteria bacterium]